MSPALRALVSLVVIALSSAATLLAARLQPPPPPPPSQVESIFAFGPEVVRGIEARTRQGSIKARLRDGSWRVESLELAESVAARGDVNAPSAEKVNAEVTSLVRTVVALPEVNRFPQAGSLAEFGLDDPRARIVLRLDGGEVVTLEIGARTTTGVGLYARITSSDEILQVGGLILNEIGGSFFQLRGLSRSS